MKSIDKAYQDFLKLCKKWPWIMHFVEIVSSLFYGVFVTVAVYEHWTFTQTVSMLALLTFAIVLGIYLGMTSRL